MKTAFTILFTLALLSLSAANTVAVNFEIRNVLGDAIPNAELELFTPNSSETVKFESGKEGNATIRLERNRKYLLQASHPDYLMGKVAFNLDSSEFDVTKFTIELDVQISIGHNLQWINLDSMYIILIGDSLSESLVFVSNRDLIGIHYRWMLTSDESNPASYFMWKNRMEGIPYYVNGKRLIFKVSLSEQERDVVQVECMGKMREYYATWKSSILGDGYEFDLKE